MGIYDQHQPKSEGGGLYLKLDDGETVRLRIASEPVIYENVYTQPDGTDKITTRYAWLVWNTEAATPHVLQQSATFYRNIANFASDPDYGDPTLYDIKVKREGTGTDTIYHITPSPKPYELPDEAKEELAKLDLLELVKKGRGVQRPMWLTDFIKQQGLTPEAEDRDAYDQSGYKAAKAKAEEIKKKKTADSDNPELALEEPVNLDDIPF